MKTYSKNARNFKFRPWFARKILHKHSQAEASPPLLYLPRVATRRLWHQQRRRTATGKVGEKLFTVGT